MITLHRKETLLLFTGDLFFFMLSLWITLFLRYTAVPSKEIFVSHVIPFSILFVLWFLTFFIAGLYEKHTTIFKNKLPTIILNAQIANSLIAAAFFYFVPLFGINPKTNLFIYVIVSFVLILVWRLYAVNLLGFRKRERAVLIGSGDEMRELKEEVNNNSRYSIKFVSSIDVNKLDGVDFQNEVLNTIHSEGINSIVVDMNNEKIEPILPKLYNLIFSKVKFIEMHKVYEEIFDRTPLSIINYDWFLENISFSSHVAYDFLKRLMDLTASLVLGTVSLVLYPFVIVAIKMEDGGPVFFIHERIGQNNRIIKIIKFRSMSAHRKSDPTSSNEERRVMRVGSFLRKTRIDELPQLWNVIVGDISLVGPRPELPELVNVYEKEISYYNVRHLIKPGLSGWAQIHPEKPPKFGLAHDETKVKLSYDLYYIKNRSLMLDLKIALKTIKTLFMRSGI